MKKLPLLEEHPRPVQFVLAVVVPALFGGLAGYFLGVSEPVYLILSLIGIAGGVGAGFDHVGAKAGAARGAVAGSVFGASILIAHELHGAAATAHLPEPAILLVAVTTILAVGFAALGGWLRERTLRTEAVPMEPQASGFGGAGSAGARQGALSPPSSGSVPAGGAPAAAAPQAATGALAVGAPAPTSTTARGASGTVSLNSGTFEEYRALGMSVTQAKRVIVYRERLDGYSSIDELDRVPGFSRDFLGRLKQQLGV